MSIHRSERSNDMRARLTKLGAALTAVAALAFGGAALAGAASSTPSPPAAVDVQQGDQTTPDIGAQASESSSESVSSESGSESVESASESSVASDGPGGHADEPGNASADYQFQGEQ
jgi:hypothetical protein